MLKNMVQIVSEHLFTVRLENSVQLFLGDCLPQNRLVEIFHAGTPPLAKEHITKNLADKNGHLRILVCTIAFGMGVNCKKV
jgi:superfamily II DNA helicase RecQ